MKSSFVNRHGGAVAEFGAGRQLGAPPRLIESMASRPGARTLWPCPAGLALISMQDHALGSGRLCMGGEHRDGGEHAAGAARIHSYKLAFPLLGYSVRQAAFDILPRTCGGTASTCRSGGRLQLVGEHLERAQLYDAAVAAVVWNHMFAVVEADRIS